MLPLPNSLLGMEQALDLCTAIDQHMRRIVREELATLRAPVRLLSIDQAAERLGIARSTTYALIGSGLLWSVEVGRRRLVPEDALAEVVGGRR